MKLVCIKKYLKEAVNLCERITGKNLSLPILGSILISGENNKLKLTATNLEIGIEVEIPAKVEKKGIVAVPGGIIGNFLSNFSGDENINLESNNENLSVSTTNTSTLIKGQPTDDFPSLPKVNSEKTFSISASDFILGLKSSWYASSLSNIKPELSSVYVSSDKNKPLVFTATDSFRLAEKKFNYSFEGFGTLLIPYKTVAEILRIFDGRDGKININPNKNQIYIEMDNIKFVSRLIEGVFPDYQQIIPKKFTADVVVNKDLFISSLKIASIFSGKLNELEIGVEPDDNMLIIKTSSVETGEHITTIPSKVTGEKLRISFNHKYVFDCLSHISTKEIVLRFSGENKPLLITGAGETTFQYLVMPMSGV